VNAKSAMRSSKEHDLILSVGIVVAPERWKELLNVWNTGWACNEVVLACQDQR
jgi:hypothetical protein